MFETFRKMIVPIIVIVLLFFVAMIVLEWGLGFSSRQSFQDTNLAAVINGEDVTWQQYNNIYNNLLQNEIQKTEDGEVPQQKKMELHERAWQQLVHERILLQQVAKQDISVSPEEIYSFLKLSPPPDLQAITSFQTDGKFDYQKYIAAMADPQASSFWASLEPYIRTEIMKLKVQEQVIQSVSVSEEEVKRAYMDYNETIKVGYINVGFDRFSRDVSNFSEEELKNYFEEHKSDYQLDERRSLNVAMLEKKPQPYDWEVSYNKIKAIYDSIQAGADFAEMAKRYSADGSAQDGGDLGWFNKGQMVAEFDKMVFSMDPNTVSEPVRTQFGWHIIKLFDRKEEKDTPRGKQEPEMVKKAHASHILIKAEMSQESKDEMYNRLTAFHEGASRSGFLKAIEDESIPLRQTDAFFRNGNIQYIGNNIQVSDFAFDNELNAISDIMENNSAFFIVQVREIRPAGQASFEESREKVNMNLLTQSVMQMCKDTIGVIWSEIQSGADLEKAAKDHGEDYTITDPFKRVDFVREFRRDPKAIGTAFSMTETGQVLPPFEHDQGMAIFKLIDRTIPDLTDYNSKRDSVYYTLVNQKQQAIYTRWFDNLVQHSEIVNNVQKALAENPDFL